MTRAEQIEKAARKIRGGPEGCLTQPNCGACAWCDLDRALALPVDPQATTRDELERFAVRCGVSMQTVIYRKVMEYIIPKVRGGGDVDLSEVDHLLIMVDSFMVLDNPEVQKWIETLLGKALALPDPTATPSEQRYRRGMKRLVGNARCNECLTHKPALTCFDCDPDGSCGWMVCDECLQGALLTVDPPMNYLRRVVALARAESDLPTESVIFQAGRPEREIGPPAETDDG